MQCLRGEKNTDFCILILECDKSNAPFKSNVQGQEKKAFQAFILIRKPKGNRIPVSRVTDGDAHHYTTKELDALDLGLMVYEWGKAPSHFKVK